MSVLAIVVTGASVPLTSSEDLITKLDGISITLFVFAGLAILILLIILLSLNSSLNQELERRNTKTSKDEPLITNKSIIRQSLKDSRGN